MVAAHLFWKRTYFILDCIECVVASSRFEKNQSTTIVCGSARYSSSSYFELLTRTHRSNVSSKRKVSNAECEIVGITEAYVGSEKVFFNYGSRTQNSDADIAFVLSDKADEAEALFGCLFQKLKAFHSSEILSLGRDLDMNIYVDDTEQNYVNLLHTATEDDVRLYRDAILLKLERHSIIPAATAKRMAPDVDRKTTLVYKAYEKRSKEAGASQKARMSFLAEEANLYAEYFRRTVDYVRSPSLRTLYFSLSLKIEGYVCLPTLLLYLRPELRLPNALYEVVVFENLADAIIHMQKKGNLVTKSKYLYRLLSALRAATASCSREERFVVETLEAFAFLFETIRKNAKEDSFHVFDRAYLALAMQILHVIDARRGISFDTLMLAGLAPSGTSRYARLPAASAKVVAKLTIKQLKNEIKGALLENGSIACGGGEI